VRATLILLEMKIKFDNQTDAYFRNCHPDDKVETQH
jgi:hypothetical protein